MDTSIPSFFSTSTWGDGVDLCSCFADKESKHLTLSGELDQGKLNALVVGERLAEGFAGIRIF